MVDRTDGAGVLARFMDSMKRVVKNAPIRDQELFAGVFMEVPVGAKDYVSVVCDMELERRQPEPDVKKVNELDRSRSIIHNSLIGKVDACNRLCEKSGAPLIYTGGKNRREYGDYAVSLIEELFKERG